MATFKHPQNSKLLITRPKPNKQLMKTARVVMQMPGDSAPGGDVGYLRSLVNTARVAGAD